ncbi:MAG: aspartate aminotransferase family protein, partial [Microbacterium sp.]
AELGRLARARLAPLAAAQPRVRVKGRGLFFGLELLDEQGNPDAGLARRVVEGMYARHVLISRIGRDDNVLKIRPPLVIGDDDFELALATLEETVREALAVGE